jgi:hypothetical protein
VLPNSSLQALGPILSALVLLAIRSLALAPLLVRATKILIIQAGKLLESKSLVLSKAFLEIVVQEFRFSIGFLSLSGLSLIDWIFVQPRATGFFKI